MRYYAIAILLLLTIGNTTAQSIITKVENLDVSKNKYSFAILRKNVRKAKTDLEKVHALNELAEFHNNSFEAAVNADSALFYTKSAQEIITKNKNDIAFASGDLLSKQTLALVAARKGRSMDSIRTQFYSMKKKAFEENDLENLADAYNNLGNMSAADSGLYYYEKAINLADSIGYYKVVAYASGNMADRLNEKNKIRSYYSMAFDAYVKHGNYGGLGLTLSKIGEKFIKSDQIDSAILFQIKAIDFFKKLGFKYQEPSLYLRYGQLLGQNGQITKSLSYFTKANVLSKELNDKILQAQALFFLGYAYGNLSNYSMTLEYLLDAVPIYKSIGNYRMQIQINSTIGAVYARLKMYDKAIVFTERALNQSIRFNDFSIQQFCHYSLAQCYSEQKEYTKALKNARSGLKIAKEKGFNFLSDTMLIGNCQFNLKKYQEAYICYVNTERLIDDESKKNSNVSDYEQKGALFYSLSNLLFELIKIDHKDGLIAPNGNRIKPENYLSLAKKYIEYSIVESRKYEGSSDIKAERVELYSKILFATKDYANAYLMQLESKQLMDSVFNQEKSNEVANVEYAQKAIKDSLKNEHAKLKIEKEHVTAMAKKDNQRNVLVFSGLGILLLAGGLFTRLRYVRKSKAIIQKEKEHAEHERKRSDELLLNILPSDVAEELKDKGSIKAKHIDDVSILFTDCEGFTQASEKMTPTELVDEINIYFKAFDLICEKHNIEKIKTIGDAYMAASGLGSKNKVQSLKDASNLVFAALEMQDFVHKRSIELETLNLKPFQMRFGIHTGPVVAGIVGIKKFQYDIWGDTVNTAARMESASEVGRVNISQTTYKLLKDDADFAFESRGKIEAKGKGEIEMFFVSLKKQ